MKIWDNKKLLDSSESARNLRRILWGRLTFDCHNAKCQGDKVKCSMNHNLGSAKDGTMALIGVLQGRTASCCRSCKDFEGGGMIDCPYYIAPRYYVDPKTDKGYEGTAMCDLSDKACLMEYEGKCEELERINKEKENE